MSGFPGVALAYKVELSLNSVWTDVTQYVRQRDNIAITNMGRPDESSSIQAAQCTLTLANDGRFTPKNSAGAYYPNITRNTPIRVSINSTSGTGVNYNGSRFYGEVSSWPPGFDVSGRDVYVQVTASGIWRRISQNSVSIGSSYTRYVQQLTGTNVPATYWAMEDGSGSTAFVTTVGAGGAAAISGTPSFAADSTSFAGSDALCQFNGARVTANVSSAATPTNNVVRFALSVPAAGDSNAPQFSGGQEVCKVLTNGTGVKRFDVSLHTNQVQIHGYATAAGGTALISAQVTTPVNGVPVLVSLEITPSGGSINWALKVIKPNAGSVLDSVSGTRASTTIGAVTTVILNGQGRLSDTAGGQLGVFYAVPSLTTAAAALGGHAGEFAVDRFNRLCAEFGIATEVTGSTSAAMGPQVDDTLANILQGIENTDGGILYESRNALALGYRTLISLQNQTSALSLSFTGSQIAEGGIAPVYDDQLIRNSWTVSNWDGYTALAQCTSGAISTQAPPNGVGQGYAGGPLTINANTHAQVNAIAQQKLFTGCVDDVRWPSVTVNLAAPGAASLFASWPGLRVGDFFQLTNLPAYASSATSKQLCWGYSETIQTKLWTITVNAIPEAPWETTFSPGVFSVTQAPSGSVAQGGAVGATVSAAQIGAGAALPATISARSIGGNTSFISTSTPYDWTFAVSGTPADVTYFIATEDQTLPIATGDTFTSSGGFGGPFTVTSLDPPTGGNVNVHFTPDATSVMSTGTVFGGKNGDSWINSSGGYQVNLWTNGAWVPVSWTASSVLTASSITSSLIAAGTIIAGVVDGTTIAGATIIADGTSGEILVYSGTPATGNLIGSWSGASGTDAHSNTFPAGLAVEQGGLVLYNQSSAPASVTGASSFYSSIAGRPRYLAQTGENSVMERGSVNVSAFTVGNTTTASIISGALNYFGTSASNQSSMFEIEISGAFHTATSGTLHRPAFSLFSDGSAIGDAITIGGAATNTNVWYSYTVTFRLAILTSGSSGTCVVVGSGTMAQEGVAIGGTTATELALGSTHTSSAFDTTSNHTLQIYGFWDATNSGQEIDTYITRTTYYS